MRPITNKELQRSADLSEIRAADTELRAARPEDRSLLIDAKEGVCSALRSKLWDVGMRKCWYSEARLLEGEGHVEHFRPKKRLWGTKHDGYWWRAFDWQNLRLAHSVTNRRMTDYVTGRKAGKGSYFPVEPEAGRAFQEADEKNEPALLLDPIVPSDTDLLSFSPDTGAPVPTYSVNADEWRHKRALASIEYYHLDEGTWNMERHDRMQAVLYLCDQLEDVVATKPRDHEAYSDLKNKLWEYTQPYAQFSSACRSVVRERGLLDHVP